MKTEDLPLVMKTPNLRWATSLSVKAGTEVVPFHAIARIDGARIEQLELDLHLLNGDVVTARGIDAIEAAMQLKPVLLEGHRLRFAKGQWAVHNLLGHPLMQLLALFGFYRLAFRVHDATVPRPLGIKTIPAARTSTV